MAEAEAQGMAGKLERYIVGSGAGIFNEQSSVSLDNPFIVFSVRDLQEELRPMGMYLILDFIWTRIRKDYKQRIMVVDEAWYMMLYPDSAKFLYSMVKRARKYNLGITTITQDVEDFLKNDLGRAIINNSAIKFLMKQSPNAIERVGKVFNLSEGEKSFLLNADRGQGLFFAGNNHVAIQAIASKSEHDLITTDPRDIARLKGVETSTKDITQLAQMYEPPAMQAPIKGNVNKGKDSPKTEVEKAVYQRKKDVARMIKEVKG